LQIKKNIKKFCLGFEIDEASTNNLFAQREENTLIHLLLGFRGGQQ
jgi:hypothetical protein